MYRVIERENRIMGLRDKKALLSPNYANLEKILCALIIVLQPTYLLTPSHPLVTYLTPTFSPK
jgi:hypothetical protein